MEMEMETMKMIVIVIVIAFKVDDEKTRKEENSNNHQIENCKESFANEYKFDTHGANINADNSSMPNITDPSNHDDHESVHSRLRSNCTVQQ